MRCSACLIAALCLSASGWAQYDIALITYTDPFLGVDLVTWHLNEDDRLNLLDVAEDVAFNYLDPPIIVDERGRWMVIQLGPDITTDRLQLFSIGATGEIDFIPSPALDFETFSHALLPDSSGLVAKEMSGDLQHLIVDLKSGLVTGVSRDVSPEFDLSFKRNPAVSQRGLFGTETVVLQGRRTWSPNGGTLFVSRDALRVYPLLPDLTFGEPGPVIPFSDPAHEQYFARDLKTSRDGYLIISVGAVGYNPQKVNETAFVCSVSTTGEVEVVDSLLWEEAAELFPDHNFLTVTIAPRRNFIVMTGDYDVMAWSLNPDGTFGEGLWDLHDMAGGGPVAIALSADPRVLLAGRRGWLDGNSVSTLTGIRLDLDGRIESLSELVLANHRFMQIKPAFITRRGPGDCNGDGWVDEADVPVLVDHLIGVAPIPHPVDLDHADVNRDGRINAADLTMLIGL